ncbi:MAG: ABC transporter ATP-binding protein, partial [Actinobacteria bacterium]|nr:ABC transporter ATP-binding protein [Actinomycetota bacterium]
MGERLLTVHGLSTHFFTYAGVVKAVNGVSFTLDRKETLGIVGESGSGKTVAALSLMRLIPDPPGKVVEGSLMLGDRDLRTLTDEEMRQVRGNDIAMIFQDPMTSLNPVLTIEEQLVETIRAHRKVTSDEARRRAIELLEMVGIPKPETRLKSFPHQFSGGMRQRVMIAMALALEPKL